MNETQVIDIGRQEGFDISRWHATGHVVRVLGKRWPEMHTGSGIAFDYQPNHVRYLIAHLRLNALVGPKQSRPAERLFTAMRETASKHQNGYVFYARGTANWVRHTDDPLILDEVTNGEPIVLLPCYVGSLDDGSGTVALDEQPEPVG